MTLIFSTFFLLLSSLITAQQNYSPPSCGGDTEPFGLYSCNGRASSCRAFLIFKSKPPYNSVPSISNLTSSNPDEIAIANNVTVFSLLKPDTAVVVPLHCSCIDQFYQANASFVLAYSQTYYFVATEIYQGSTTCQALKFGNKFHELDLRAGLKLLVPLRCACPTTNQARKGVEYLVTYLVGEDDTVLEIGERFNVSKKSVLEANGFQEEDDPNLFPFSTILIPLSIELTSSQIQLPSPSTADRPEKASSRQHILVDIAKGAGFLTVVIAVVVFAVFFIRKTRAKGMTSNNDKNMIRKWTPPADIRVEIAGMERAVEVFKFEEITKATRRFSQKNRVNGSVFRGTFENKTKLVAKRTTMDTITEVNMLKKIHHFNLVKLEGVCENDGDFYLLFEFMENGSLREWLDKGSRKERRSWRTRIQIALDIANGLHYLHSFTRPAYVHNNINSSNILLNSNLRAKLSNFSLARVTERAIAASVSTTNLVGAKGYMAREAGLVTPKTDVFAFGVVVLELVSRKEAVFREGGREVLLSTTMIPTIGNNVESRLTRFLDSKLKEPGKMEFGLQMVKLSAACLNREPEQRPSMGEVVSTLLKIQDCLQKLKPSPLSYGDRDELEGRTEAEINVEP
ncbi:protein LYK5-like [Cucurbita pepo subsp. pepo]|uniref:protein LYK5-like n=1 Tax=Cucurbita pepo subsp. pepo TaxID=3664 RepID=UPI000C9D69B9|nr:protein LYK5-like [Cucurbita pepo subsp. pepo]